jgi:hypothetical protein
MVAMKYEAAHRIAIEHNWNSISWLFQRLNFFFVGMAFLITAFVASLPYRLISFVLGGTGLLLSVGFWIIISANNRLILKNSEYIRSLESKDPDNDVEVTELPSLRLKEIANSPGLWKPMLRVKGAVAPHANWIPLLFIVVWVALLILDYFI